LRGPSTRKPPRGDHAGIAEGRSRMDRTGRRRTASLRSASGVVRSPAVGFPTEPSAVVCLPSRGAGPRRGRGGLAWSRSVRSASAATVLDWITDRLPDIDLPSIPWPDIDLPSIPWPDIDLPELAVPSWLRVVLGTAKFWLPVLLAIGVTMAEIRRQRAAADREGNSLFHYFPPRRRSSTASGSLTGVSGTTRSRR
jgi:hypothetical protein